MGMQPSRSYLQFKLNVISNLTRLEYSAIMQSYVTIFKPSRVGLFLLSVID